MEGPVQREIVEAAQRGDHEAFEVLATGSADRLYAVARLILRDLDLAQDAVQESLVQAWRGLPRLRDPERFDAWMHRLLVNACFDQARRQRRWSAKVRVIRNDLPSQDEVRSIADRDQIERGFRRLRPEQRAVVVLHYYLGLSVPEAARVMSIPVGTAKSRLHYALETMRAALEADGRPTVAMAGKTA